MEILLNQIIIFLTDFSKRRLIALLRERERERTLN